jgi:predicted unusual protein kinase regulating ubiquinone biosynthesis (AarF/ABC1/UbiB family)
VVAAGGRPGSSPDRDELSLAERVYRARRIGVTFGRTYLGFKTHQFIERTLAPRDMPARWSRLRRDSANSIYDAAIELRGLILKGCQFLGSRTDVLPAEYIDRLSGLQDRVPAKPFPVVRRSVESELGAPLESIFSSFARQPVAAASLAQVHEAELPSGERVAVKVQYPDIARLVHSDLANLHVLFRAVDWLERDFDLMPLVEELGATMPLELDFEHEGRTAETISGFFADRDDIHVPKIHWEYSSQRVLVMEYIDGIKISDRAALEAAGVDTTQVMKTLIEAYCEQLLVRGLFHADPHPGNLLVQPGEKGAPPRIVFLDFGLSKRLPTGFRQGIVTLATALLGGDAKTMGRALLELGFVTRDGKPDSLQEIARIVLDVATRLRHQSFVDPKVVAEAREEIPRLIRENPIIRVPSHVVLIGRVVGLLSGLGNTLDAKLDMLTTILPYVMRLNAPPGTDAPDREDA